MTSVEPVPETRSALGPALKPHLEIALVNNMPDAALQATERQFASLITEAARDDLDVGLRLYALAGVPRSDLARATMRGRYAWVEALEEEGADAVIVTGCEPRAKDLREEPYWPTLAGLIDWAQTGVRASLWSCLAAHAAVLHLDGVERRPLEQKLSGVFTFQRRAESSLALGFADPIQNPHSRHNGLSASDLLVRGYEVVTQSDEAGVDMFVRQGESLQIFLQGHPEYDADSLMREFRRDLGRFLRGERAALPPIPHGYFDAQTEHALRTLELCARRGSETEHLQSYDAIAAGFRPTAPWRAQAVRLYRNWLELVAAAKFGQSRQTIAAQKAAIS